MPAVGPFRPITPPGAGERVGGLVREVIGGDQRAAIRRIILWVLAFGLLVGGAPTWATVLPLSLLCLTDGLV